MTKGCDYSWDRPNLDSLRAAGITFACRYLSYDRTGKNLTLNEARALQAKGIAPVSNWEWQIKSALGGYAVGQQHARDAAAQHLAFGGPPDRPIYFSVDFDQQPLDDHAVAGYFDGVNSVLGVARTGVYGGYRTVSSIWGSGRAKWIWQTSAWSRGVWHPQAGIRQVDYGILIGGGRVDIDQSFGTDFGQWGAASVTGGEVHVETGEFDLSRTLYAMGDYHFTSGIALDGYAAGLRGLIR